MATIKPLASYVLAFACMVLAGVMFFDSRKAKRERFTTVAASQPVPALVSDDLSVLDRPVRDQKFVKAPLQDIIRALVEETHINITADWPSLDDTGVARDRLVTVSIGKTTLANALTIVLTSLQMPKPGSVPGFYVSDGGITITTAEEADHHTQLAMFNIRGLVDELIMFDTGRGYSVPQMMSLGPPAGAAEYNTVREATIEQIEKCIIDIIAPELWKDFGGSVASIREINGILVIQQTPTNLRLISILLQRLDEAARSKGVPGSVTEVSQQSLGTTEATAAFFNIAKIKTALHAGRPPMNPATMPAVEDPDEVAVDAAIGAVDHDSWDLNGGNARREYVGNVLVVVQTPWNIDPVRKALVRSQTAGVANDPQPATVPANSH